MSKLYLYPGWLRIWHLLNALSFLLLIVTGLAMAYQVPPIRFDYAVSIHNITGIILTINYLFYFLWNFKSRNFQYYRFALKGLTKNLLIQLSYYSRDMFRGKPHPFPVNSERKFNPLQQFSYVIVMYFIVPLIFVSGFFLLLPYLIFESLFGIPGLLIVDQIHVISACLAFLFMLIHIYFCTIGATPTSNFKAMITGWHESHE
jgi:thiosulfate reductase cytochrome b subunit